MQPIIIAAHFLVWWITLSAVLPFGVKSQHEDGEFAEGTDPGAPVIARIGTKPIWTTILRMRLRFSACFIWATLSGSSILTHQ